jgi:hypothetical protein
LFCTGPHTRPTVQENLCMGKVVVPQCRHDLPCTCIRPALVAALKSTRLCSHKLHVQADYRLIRKHSLVTGAAAHVETAGAWHPHHSSNAARMRSFWMHRFSIVYGWTDLPPMCLTSPTKSSSLYPQYKVGFPNTGTLSSTTWWQACAFGRNLNGSLARVANLCPRRHMAFKAASDCKYVYMACLQARSSKLSREHAVMNSSAPPKRDMSKSPCSCSRPARRCLAEKAKGTRTAEPCRCWLAKARQNGIKCLVCAAFAFSMGCPGTLANTCGHVSGVTRDNLSPAASLAA